MGRTTPPPPLDIAAVFPELEPLARRTVRLHPRAGAPGSGDSSLGGLLLWPAGEPWPTCQQPHDRLEPIPMPPEIMLPEAPSPLVGVLQLYARDVPDLPFPEHTDAVRAVPLSRSSSIPIPALCRPSIPTSGSEGRWLPVRWPARCSAPDRD